MMQLIAADYYGDFIGDIAEMHRLRYRVFKNRLNWDVQVSGDMEIDEFDAFRPAYLALLWQIFTHAVARRISIFGSVDIAVEAVEPRAREWRDVRRAELAGAVGR